MNAPPQTTSSVHHLRAIDPDVVFRMDLGGVVGFATAEGRIVEIDVIADPESCGR
jgi:hypothetical protein